MDHTPAPALSISDLRKTYDNGVEALRASASTSPRRFRDALLGPNGAGRAPDRHRQLAGQQDRGHGARSGIDLDADRDGAMRQIGLVPQELNFNMFEKPLDICVNYAGSTASPARGAGARGSPC